VHEDDAIADAVAEEACNLLDIDVLGCLDAAVEGISFTGAAFGSLTGVEQVKARSVSPDMLE
jgi:hypothetical protein